MAHNNNRPPAPGKRAAGGQTESNHDLVAHLEQLTERRIKSRQDISVVALLTAAALRTLLQQRYPRRQSTG
jgi:hypothetical protein